MKVYKISCSWEMYGELDIQAQSLQEAIKKTEDDSSGLPKEQHYVDASFAVDVELSEELNKLN